MLIYKITNKLNKKCYVGSTSNFERRKYEHIIGSTSENYPNYNYPLQCAFRKYGVDNFSFEIIEDNIPIEDIAKKEHDYIIKFNSLTNTGNGYNQTLYTDCAIRDPNFIKKYIELYGVRCALVDKDNTVLKKYESLHAAARDTNLVGCESMIRDICLGKKNACRSLIFRFIIDDDIVIPTQLTRVRRKQICGISIYNKQDIIYYESVSEAARQERAVRSSISKCIAGNPKYTHVHNRIWREIINDTIIQNDICIDDIIIKHSGYCVIDYNTNKIIVAKTLKELAVKTGIKWATLRRNIKKNCRIKNYGYYKLDSYGNIPEEVI